MRNPKFSHAFEVVSELPEPLRPLTKLAMNFRWTWHHETRELFRTIDKELWDGSHHNPVEFLQRISSERYRRLLDDQGFLSRLKRCEEELDGYLSDATWFDEAYPNRRGDITIAYFCAEFGVSEGLPIYSGGLGVLAGDHLKAASDLGIPLVAVGLLYARGYFRQRLNHDHWQQEVYPQYDFYQMPLTLMRGADEQPLRIEVEFPDRTVTCQVWRADVGRIPLYLLDSNVLENAPADQSITDTLYGGDEEMRIRQEIILGVGGLRALRALGISPTVCHMNEGHAAFLTVERIRQFMQDNGCDFRTARQVVVSGDVFTTHTPVPAGFDLFRPDMLERYMGKMAAAIDLPFQDFLRLGRIDRENQGEAFNMAILAMENANYVNGVSKLHAKVTREMFGARWPDYPETEVPIDSVTNGIHTMTWIAKRFAELYDEHLGDGWRRDCRNEELWAGVHNIPDGDLWAARESQRGDLVRFIRKRVQGDLERRTMSRLDFGTIGGIFDPQVLTIGFARRFATYKRATLMLTDRERLLHLLMHQERPIQIVIAGKSHPRDDGGKKLIQELVTFINESGARNRMVFLEDYDMQVARALVQGVDLWLNNPRRPMEASGTSGMKVIPNGGLNCSVLDGWWDEAYSPEVGWAIGDRTDDGDQGQQDWLDSHSLYSLLEQEIAPRFYHRPKGGIPSEWIHMMKQSIARLAPVYSTSRMVEEYARRFYMPSAECFLRMRENGMERARQALEWRARVQAAWPDVRIGKVSDGASIENPLGSSFSVRAPVRLNGLAADEVRVEAIAGQIGPNRELTATERIELHATSEDAGYTVFEGSIPCSAPGYRGYTVRVAPYHPDVNVPSELNLVRWEES